MSTHRLHANVLITKEAGEPLKDAPGVVTAVFVQGLYPVYKVKLHTGREVYVVDSEVRASPESK